MQLSTPLDFARARLGTAEIPGARHNPEIVIQFARCGHPEITNDETHWCAAEVGGDLVQAGYPASSPRKSNLMARSYASYGVKITKSAKAIQKALDEGHTVIGVWPRGAPPAGHVNFVEAVSGSYVETIDGNVSDKVGRGRYRIKDAVAFVRPHTKLAHNRHMRLSERGEQYIKEAEEAGGKPALQAYNDGTGTWTIGWGCTDGVRRGMTITPSQAQALLDYELVACADAVHRLITRPISQGLFDALVSFFFNCGWGACSKLLAAVNSGDEAAIRSAWMLYVHATDERGVKSVWPGLVNRRQSELALWTEIDAQAPEVAEQMQKWAPAEEPPKPGVGETVKIVVSSRRVWALTVSYVSLVFGAMMEWGRAAADGVASVVEAAPVIVGEAQGQISAAAQMASWFKVNWEGVCIWVAAGALTVALIRVIIDKREKKA